MAPATAAGGHDRINVRNNPVNLIDPYGENPFITWVVGGAVIGGACGAISGAITGAVNGMVRDGGDLGYLAAAGKGIFKGALSGSTVGAAVGAVVGPAGALPAGGAAGIIGNLVGGELGGPRELDFPPFEDPCNP